MAHNDSMDSNDDDEADLIPLVAGGMKSGPVMGRPLEVTVDQDHVDRAINRLKRKMADEGILKELKKRRFYEKPSVKKKRKMREAERRRRKDVKRRIARSRTTRI